MNDNELRPTAPPTGRFRVPIVFLTFIALCIAFFAGSVHQSDSLADSHDSTSAIAQITAPTGLGAEPTTDVASTSDGWMTALVSACALFALLTLARIFRIRLGALLQVLGALVEPVHRAMPVAARAPASAPALAQLSVSRT
jgi:hypothetical protein